jgi:hypothetical protein
MAGDLVTITNGTLSAAINPLGAELWSLTDAAGAEYMTDADPAFWGGHAPLLFPIVGGLVGDTYRVEGPAYHLPRHGFARRSLLAVQVEDDLPLFGLSDSEETHAVYPFAFVLAMAFRWKAPRCMWPPPSPMPAIIRCPSASAITRLCLAAAGRRQRKRTASSLRRMSPSPSAASARRRAGGA